MKYKVKIAVICLTALLLSILTGCQLAREDAGTKASEDRLIGVFLTTEHLDLFDFEGYLNDNIGSLSGGEIKLDGTTEEYQGRRYAELRPRTLTNTETGEKVVTKEYVFPGFEGITYFSARVPTTAEQEGYVTSGSDEAISDGHMNLKYTDQGDSTTMEGTVYVSPGLGSTYYFNPVYQSEDGNVYAMTGSGFSTSGVRDEGAAYTQTMNATYTMTENGKIKTDSISVKISISVMSPPEKIVVLQMGADSSVVSKTEYAPGEMPESIALEENTEYIVVEAHKTDTNGGKFISRKLYGRDAESLETYYSREDGICVKKWVQVKWPE